MPDNYACYGPALDSPAIGAIEVSKSDTAELTTWSRAIYVGGTGDLKVTMADGSVVTFEDIPAGTILPIRVKIVWSNGTDATKIVAMY